jgi:D-tyrosyl-tRNA(Tyr) deacylase
VIALVQRVAQARVEVAGRVAGAIGHALLVFVCAEPDDDEAIADRLVAKLLRLRVFADAAGKMNLDLAARGLLIVSQFTSPPTRRQAIARFPAPPARGRLLYERVVAAARATHPQVACGEFGADMQVHLVNDGPVTIPITLRR